MVRTFHHHYRSQWSFWPPRNFHHAVVLRISREQPVRTAHGFEQLRGSVIVKYEIKYEKACTKAVHVSGGLPVCRQVLRTVIRSPVSPSYMSNLLQTSDFSWWSESEIVPIIIPYDLWDFSFRFTLKLYLVADWALMYWKTSFWYGDDCWKNIRWEPHWIARHAEPVKIHASFRKSKNARCRSWELSRDKGLMDVVAWK